MKTPPIKKPISSGLGLNYKYSGQLYCSWSCAEAAHGTVTTELLPSYEILQLVVIHKCARCRKLVGPQSEIFKHNQSLKKAETEISALHGNKT